MRKSEAANTPLRISMLRNASQKAVIQRAKGRLGMRKTANRKTGGFCLSAARPQQQARTARTYIRLTADFTAGRRPIIQKHYEFYLANKISRKVYHYIAIADFAACHCAWRQLRHLRSQYLSHCAQMS